jgi:hypothetical protein
MNFAVFWFFENRRLERGEKKRSILY